MPFFVYILKSKTSGTSYVGHTSHLGKRIQEHNSGKSLSTRNKRPWRLVHQEVYDTRSEAMMRERHFKSQIGRLELKAKGII